MDLWGGDLKACHGRIEHHRHAGEHGGKPMNVPVEHEGRRPAQDPSEEKEECPCHDPDVETRDGHDVAKPCLVKGLPHGLVHVLALAENQCGKNLPDRRIDLVSQKAPDRVTHLFHG